MRIHFLNVAQELLEGFQILSGFLGIEEGADGISLRTERIEAGHAVSYQGGEANIGYSSVSGAMRAFTLLAHHLRTCKENERLDIFEKEIFKTCGAMIDVSLGDTVPKVETWKVFLSYMARMGLNMLMIYTEDIYTVEEYPYFGYMRGAYTKYELLSIVDYAEKLGIELVPCIQTLAHLSKVSRWKANKPLFDTSAVLMIDENKTYEFIEAMIRSARNAFRSKRIHIGMDEAHGVCMGRYYEKYGPTNRYEALLRHLNRVIDICKKYDFAPMMWSDMFFRLGSKTNDYYDITADIPENILKTIPKEVSQVYWDYYHTDANTYEKLIKAHQAMGDVVFAGGVWTWTGFAPKYRQTLSSTYPALDMCRRNGINHVFATVWNSDYSECDFFNALLGLQIYAEYHAGAIVTDAHLEKAFYACTQMHAESFLAMDLDDFREDNPSYDYDAPYSFSEVEHCIPVISKQVFYQDPLVGLFDKNFSYLDLKTHFSKAYERLSKCTAEGIEGELLGINTAYAAFVKDKCDLGICLKKAYDEGDKQKLSAAIPKLKEMIETLDLLHLRYADRYYKCNKPFGFEVKDTRFGGIRARLLRTIARIEDYISGKIDAIDELGAERLTFEDRESPFAHLYYMENMHRP